MSAMISTEVCRYFASAGAEQDFWDSLPTMPVEEVEAAVRQSPLQMRFQIVCAAIKGSPERAAALKARFTPEETRAMVSARA